MGTMTFGKSYGMLASGKDAGDLISTSTRGLAYFAPVRIASTVWSTWNQG